MNAERKAGRPKLPKNEKKTLKSIYLKPDQWDLVNSIDSNPSAAIEKLVEMNTLLKLVELDSKYAS